MRVSLLHMRTSFDCMEPLGILYLGTILYNSGHDVQLLDVFPNDNRYSEKLRKFNPQLIGLSILTPSYAAAKNVIQTLNSEFTDVYYCAGGPHPTALPAETLDDLGLDFVVVGEGEYVLREICNTYEKSNNLDLKYIKGVVYKEDGKIVDNGRGELIPNLDELPFPNRELLLNYKWYLSSPGTIRGSFLKNTVRIITSRGCPYQCIFCSSHQIFGRRVRRRSVENVIEEIKSLINRYDIKGIYFVDDTFTIDIGWVDKFCDALETNKIHLTWACQVRVNTITEEVLRHMKRAGCVQVDIGVESGSNTILRNLKKGTNVEMIKKAFIAVRRGGLRAEASFIIGSPGETMEDVFKTKALRDEIKPSMSMFNIMTPHPGSEIFEMAKANKWFIDPEMNFSEKWLTMKVSDKPVMEINLKSNEIVKLRAMLERGPFFKDHLNYAIGFFKYPEYLLPLLFCILRHRGAILRESLTALRTKRIRSVAEVIYQKFQEDLFSEATRASERKPKHRGIR